MARSAVIPPQEPASYEQALSELDRLVQQMEGGQLPLDQLLDGYRRGAELLAFCRARLQAVEDGGEVAGRGGHVEKPIAARAALAIARRFASICARSNTSVGRSQRSIAAPIARGISARTRAAYQRRVRIRTREAFNLGPSAQT